ncbi:MAG: nucleotidyltransferase family protein [Bacteroidales bacterium]|jgi:D-glycero-alpha-D-manno-heptose 1-phosphate guanylyltransferase
MDAIILAGGFGTRLQKVVCNVPKPMAPINSKPFLDYLLDYLIHYKIKNVILSVGYKHEIIKKHFEKKYKNIDIKYATEKKALGTGGGITFAMKYSKTNEVLILNGDSFFNINLKDFFSFHKKNKAELSIALKSIKNVSRYGIVNIDKQNRILSFSEKETKAKSGFVNGGIYLMNKKKFKNTGLSGKFSFEKDYIEKSCSKRKIYGFVSRNYFLDIGIPEDYEKAQTEFKKLKY